MMPAEQDGTIPTGDGRFELLLDGGADSRPLPVWTWRPPGDAPPGRALIVLHGAGRNARVYRDVWIPHARAAGAALLAPEFAHAQFPTARDYEVGRMRGPDRVPLPRACWLFAAIEQVFDAARAALDARWCGYRLYGHSAGAQLVHRMVLYAPEARIEAAVAANAGCYTLPDPEMRFPYGLGGMPIAADGLAAAFAAPLLVLLGERDDDPEHPQLLRSPEAMRQGPHRRARGLTFFAAAQARAAALGLPFAWMLATVPGAGHSNRAMAPGAAAFLFRDGAGR